MTLNRPQMLALGAAVLAGAWLLLRNDSAQAASVAAGEPRASGQGALSAALSGLLSSQPSDSGGVVHDVSSPSVAAVAATAAPAPAAAPASSEQTQWDLQSFLKSNEG